jgi:hypothetical protein
LGVLAHFVKVLLVVVVERLHFVVVAGFATGLELHVTVEEKRVPSSTNFSWL